MTKIPFTVLCVPGRVAEGWCHGRLGDQPLLFCHGRPQDHDSPALVILRVDGHAGGMRSLFSFLAAVLRRGPDMRGFAMRTRLASVERVFERFNGRVTFDEGDGDRRWFAPAEPAASWLKENFR